LSSTRVVLFCLKRFASDLVVPSFPTRRSSDLVGQAAVADGIVVGIVLDDGDRGDDRVERVSSFLEDVHALIKGAEAVGARDDERALARGGSGEGRESKLGVLV